MSVSKNQNQISMNYEQANGRMNLCGTKILQMPKSCLGRNIRCPHFPHYYFWHLEANFLRVSPWQLTLFFSLDCIHKLDKFRLHHKEFLLVTHHKEIVFTSNKFVHFLCKIQRKKKKQIKSV